MIIGREGRKEGRKEGRMDGLDEEPSSCLAIGTKSDIPINLVLQLGVLDLRKYN